jgi:DNA-binding CsgD family transcriptional regulator
VHLRESEFERATELFYEAAAVPELWPNALQAVADAAGAFGVNLLPVGPGMGAFACSPDMRGYMDDFFAGGWLKVNSYMRRGMELTAAGRRGLITSEDMLTPEESARDIYVNEHRLPGGLGPEAGMVLASAGDVAVPITIDRRGTDGPFVQAEIAKLNRLVAGLRPAAMLAVKVSLLVSTRIADSLTGIGKDLALLSASGRVLHMAPALERHIGDAIDLRAGVPRSWEHRADAALSAAIRKVVSIAPAGNRTVASLALPCRSGRRPLIVQLVPITGAAHDIFMLARAVMIITDPEATNPVDVVAEALKLMGLSPAEARLAARIGRGEELKAIAEAEGIVNETARARLKAVFAKTGTHRQAELAVLVAGLSR